mgnify:CR=1 FL=1
MTKTYLTIMMNRLEIMHIEVASASATELAARPVKSREEVYDCSRMFYIRSGTGTLRALDQERKLGPGVICILSPGIAHQIEADPDAALNVAWCHFHASFDDRDIYQNLGLPLTVRTEDAEAVGALFDKLIDAFNRCGLTSRLRVKAAVLELICCYLDAIPPIVGKAYPSQELQKIDTVLTYIDDHLAENITVEELARQVFLHPNYFIVFFKTLMGHSPIQYVNIRRMETAKALLLQPHGNVSDVAARIGMQIHYFSRMFKAHTGLAPSRYRKQAAGVGAQTVADADEDWGTEA